MKGLGNVAETAEHQIDRGGRFSFGENWTHFLDVVDEGRIEAAASSLRDYLGVTNLAGKTFVDVGSGSGLFSLAARKMGARVVSFDFDPQSVACTNEMRRRHAFAEDNEWQVLQGSVLDSTFLASLGKFDVVYSWGVLHHTGEMWNALEKVEALVDREGHLFISVYNDQEIASRMWTRVKRLYNGSGPIRKRVILEGASLYFAGQRMGAFRWAYRRLRRLPSPSVTRDRGMDRRRDLMDWVGGYPFEVAKPEQILDFYRVRGFQLMRLFTCGGGLGCNQFVFHRA
jgi:2-polyprenyl-3-methyl-5-hydroxy-6-metoxy-1,4-benzoquinol methylase